MSQRVVARPTAVVLCKWQPGLVRGALESDAAVYVILDAFDTDHLTDGDRLLLERVTGHYGVTSLDSTEEVAAVGADLLLKGVHVRRVFGHTEFAQFGVGVLGSLWNGMGAGRGISSTAPLRDKRLMKAAATRAGIRVARSLSIPSRESQREIAAAASQLQFPVVVKPTSGFGAMTTVRVDRPGDLQRVIEALPHEPLFHSRQLMVEEYIQGNEYHVDALWINGVPAWFTIGKYHVPRLEAAQIENRGRVVEGSFVVPRKDAPRLYQKALDLHVRVNSALGISTDPTHLEFFETPGGELVFSEVGIRMGGGGIPHVLTHILGGDVWELVGRSLATGMMPTTGLSDGCVGVMIFGPDKPGRITSIPDEAELAALPGVVSWEYLRRIGDIVERAESPYHRALFVVLRAESSVKYEELAARVLDEVRIEVEPT